MALIELVKLPKDGAKFTCPQLVKLVKPEEKGIPINYHYRCGKPCIGGLREEDKKRLGLAWRSVCKEHHQEFSEELEKMNGNHSTTPK